MGIKPKNMRLIGMIDSLGEITIGNTTYTTPDFAKNQVIYVRVLDEKTLIGDVIGYHNHQPFGLLRKQTA